MSLFKRSDDHDWSQRHLSHYVEGDLKRRAHRRVELHAAGCVDCSLGIRAMRALVRLIPDLEREAVPAPARIVERVLAEIAGGRAPQDHPPDR